MDNEKREAENKAVARVLANMFANIGVAGAGLAIYKNDWEYFACAVIAILCAILSARRSV